MAGVRFTDTRGKADFRALRDLLGVTQHQVAQRLGVSDLTVMNWENPRNFYGPDRRAWEWLEGLYVDADRRAGAMVQLAQQAAGMAREAGREPDPVPLTYWRTEADWARAHLDGEWHVENAVTRMTASRLRALDMPAEIRFAEPEP